MNTPNYIPSNLALFVSENLSFRIQDFIHLAKEESANTYTLQLTQKKFKIKKELAAKIREHLTAFQRAHITQSPFNTNTPLSEQELRATEEKITQGLEKPKPSPSDSPPPNPTHSNKAQK